jgi:DMSO/TMAO reductase YedYZ molybdopterin-dependent catalytic subunit
MPGGLAGCIIGMLLLAPVAATASDTLLVVGGEVDKPYVLTAAEFAALPHQRVRAEGHDAVVSDFDGVLLYELLLRAGVKLGRDLRGERVATVVVVGAADGYRAVFSVPEIDTSFNDRRVVLADRRDGKAIVPSDGPLRMVVPGEKRHGRWVRQVVSLTVRKL